MSGRDTWSDPGMNGSLWTSMEATKEAKAEAQVLED